MENHKLEDHKEIISLLMKKARAAQEAVESYNQEQIDDICFAAGWEVYKDDNIQKLAELAVRETGMGNVDDKIKKHKGKILGVLKDIKGALSVGLIEEDTKKGIRKYAKAVGVVGALTPVTNPTATPGSNAVSILKGGNAVIFAPHPRSVKASTLAVNYMRQGLKKVGAPEDLIQIVEEPSIPLTGELMKQVDLVLATGGSAMVKAAYSSGTPAFGVGPGNSVQLMAEDADPEDAVRKVALSKCFDYATSCSSENSLIIHESLYSRALDFFLNNEKAYLCKGKEREKLKKWMWQPNKKGNLALYPGIIAKSAYEIANDAGISVPRDTRLLLVEGSLPLVDDLFAREKLSPVLTLWTYSEFEEGFDLLKGLTDNCGTGHSCGIFTENRDYVDFLGRHMKSSRIMVNQPQAPANGGNFFNGMPSTVTLGCGTWGGNISTENIYYKHFLNISWVSDLLPLDKPEDEEFFASFWQKYGR